MNRLKIVLNRIKNFISIGIGILLLLAITVYALYEMLTSPSIISGLLLLFIAIILFVVKYKKRCSYGVFELLFGFFCAILPYTKTFYSMELLINIDNIIYSITGLFIMVQGFENIIRGMKKKGIILSQPLNKLLGDDIK